MKLEPEHQQLSGLLTSLAKRQPDAIAIEGADRTPLTYRGLAEQLQRNRRALRSFGIGPADRVAIVLPDGPEAAVVFLSVAACAVAAPLNPAFRAGKFAFYFEELSARAVVVPAGSTGAAVDAACARGIPIIEVLPRGESAGAVDLFCQRRSATARESDDATPDSVALVLATSGTTARPNLVPLTHRNLCASANNTATVLELGPSDRSLHIVPHFHIHGLVGALLSPLAAGGTVICTPGFSSIRVLDWIDRFAPTWFTAVPTIHQAIADQAVQRGSIPVSSTLRFIRSVSAPLPRDLLSRLERLFAVPVIEGYGMTEASPQICCNPLPPRVRKPGSVGIAAGPEVAVIDERGLELGPHQVGQIVVRGKNVMNGYERNQQANASAFVDGWFRTGDQGYRDEDGYFFITGRLKEIINRGGEKVSPHLVDSVLLSHPSVAQAATFPVPDKQLGEAVAAAVVLRTGASLTQSQLRQFVATRLAPFKVPYRIVFLQDLPKGPTGKLQRFDLAERLGLVRADGAVQDDAPRGRDAHQSEDDRHRPTRPRAATERVLAQLWTAALGVTSVGLHEDFFELGGNSISAVQMLFQVHRLFGIALPMNALYESPTIDALAEKLAWRLGPGATAPAVAVRRDREEDMTPTERRLAAIWEEELGVHPVGIDDNFFDLGGELRPVARLFERIRAVFGKNLPVHALLRSPTVKGLARVIDGAAEATHGLVVPLQSEGSAAPIFGIHDGAGYFFYWGLASRVGIDRPFYAVQSERHINGWKRPYDPYGSVEELATQYIREIRAVRPHGPYHLLGVSFGGIVAFEMARQLHAQGEKVGSLFLLSAFIENGPHAASVPSGNHSLRHRLRRHLIQLSSMETGAAVKYIAGKVSGACHDARRSLWLTIERLCGDVAWRWRAVWQRPIPPKLIYDRYLRASRSLIRRYRPGVYDGRAILFRGMTDRNPVPGWKGLALGGLEVHNMPGGHIEMTFEPTVEALASLIRAHLEDTDPSHQSHQPQSGVTRRPSSARDKLSRQSPEPKPAEVSWSI